jgi:two-component system sensor histidine kinase HydH
MTARLVGLMSIVLFLSLLAFSVLLDQSRAAILAEVQRTVSTVGSETLAAMSERALFVTPGGVTLTRDSHFEIAIGSDEEHEERSERGGRPPQGFRVVKETSRTGVAGKAGERPDPPSPPNREELGVWMEAIRARGQSPIVLAHDAPHIELTEGAPQMQVRIEFLRFETTAEAPPAGPTGERVMPEGATGTTGYVIPLPTPPLPFRDAMLTFDPRPPDGMLPAAIRDQLVFQVPVKAYDSVFAAIRDRSIGLLLLVFVVGTALSAALARRFTRPIRALDRALDRVSAGDLDVVVTPGGGGEVARLALAFNAMTARLKASRERERELSRREKLSALGRLAAGVAHDVRNPLHSIGLVLQNLEDVARPGAVEERGAFDRAMQLIRREIKRLDGLVANFLSFARSEGGTKRRVAIPELLRETAQLVAKEAERRGVEVEIREGGALPEIGAVPESLRSAVLNLVLNALEATPAGGKVELAARAGDSGAAVILEISDTGKGIAEEDRERVFEFGYTTREGGHGLGLAMVHHTVVEEHGGRIALDSEIGRGTTVRVELPAGDAA